VPVGVLELMHERAHGAREMRYGPRAIVGRRPCQSPSGDHALAGVEGQRDAQNVAERRANKVHLPPASRAQRVVLLERRAAHQTGWRHDDVGNRRERAGHGKTQLSARPAIRQLRRGHHPSRKLGVEPSSLSCWRSGTQRLSDQRKR
jgi:hypothetical protein